MPPMTEVEITINDTNNGRDAKFTIDSDKTIGEAVEKGYDELGEKRRPIDHFADGKGNDLDGMLDRPVRTIELDREGEATIQITGPSGGAYIFLIGGAGRASG